jgi:ribosomal protein S18 acetylase RimI-like enzyme
MHPLDNVIFQALSTRQTQFAEVSRQARRFIPDVSLLSAFAEPSTENFKSLANLVGEGENAGLFFAGPYESRAGWELVLQAPLLEMVCENGAAPHDPSTTATEIVELGLQDSAEMVELARLTKPGPFGPRTHELGTYLGIRSEGKLVAMAGERMKVPGYTEISAVCTHPDHVGKGYARVLMSELMRQIRERGECPFLHVRR